MADTIREQIISAFTLRAQALSTNAVTRAKRSHTNDSAVKNVSIWDGDDITESSAYGAQKLSFTIALDIQFTPALNASVEANATIGDAVKAIMLQDGTFSGLAERTQYTSSTITYPQDGGSVTAVVVLFTIFYATQLGDPFVAIN